MSRWMWVAAVLAIASGAAAGVRIETIERDIKTKAVDGPPQIVLVQDGKVRVNNGTSGGMILKGGQIYILDAKRKSYRQMDRASMKASMDQAGAAMRQMQERMKGMPPEQRAQMERMMGGAMPGMGGAGKAPTYTSKDTGKGDTAQGRKCRVWHVLKDGRLLEELCVVPFSSLPGKENFEKTFKELAESFEGLAGAVPGAGDQSKARSAIQGYPVRVRPYENGKPRGTETVLQSWTEESIPAATFEVPKGYKKQESPPMGPMGSPGR